MNFVGCLLILIAGYLTLSVNAVNEYDLYKRHPNLNLINIVTRSKGLLQINPSSTTDQCFNDYMGLLNSSSEKYELSYKSCLDTSQAERIIAEDATLEEREQLYKQAKASCDLISPCKDVKTAVDSFECYVNAGSENFKAMYVIKAEASKGLAELLEQYHFIEYKVNKCTRNTQRAYEYESTKAHEDLNYCLLGANKFTPTDSPGTDASSSDELSTEDPNCDGAPKALTPNNLLIIIVILFMTSCMYPVLPVTQILFK